MLRKLCTGGLLVAGMMAAPVAFSQTVHQALSELESIMADDSRRDAAYAASWDAAANQQVVPNLVLCMPSSSWTVADQQAVPCSIVLCI